jgi:hypothetical protein
MTQRICRNLWTVGNAVAAVSHELKGSTLAAVSDVVGHD